MTCGVCGATIADKAIVCYRCGAPTAAPAAPAAGPRPPARPRRSPLGGLVVLVLGLAVLFVGLLVPIADETSQDAVRLAGLGLAIIGGVRLIVRRR